MLPSVDLYQEAQVFPATLRGRGIAASAADLARTGVTKDAARWRSARGGIARLHRGAYLLGHCLADLLDRARAALLVSPAGSVLGFHTAAALLGFGVAASPDVHIVVAAGGPFPQRLGIVAHQSTVPVGTPATPHGLPCTPPARCAIDLARALRRPDALATLDAALAAGACTVDALAAELTAHVGLPGVRQARDLVAIADPRPQCRQESHLRLLLHEGGVRDLQPQWRVADDYGLISYYLDLADPLRRVGIEYDGASHLDRARMRHDRERHNWLADHGWRMRYFTDRDLYGRPDEIVRVVAATRRSWPR